MTSIKELHKKRLEVIRLHKTMMPIMTIVKECELSYPAVKMAIKLHAEGGMTALQPVPRGRKLGTGRVFTKEQEKELCYILFERKPSQEGIKQYYRQSIWNREILSELIYDKYGITIHSRTLSKYLNRWGFPPMKKNYQPISGCSGKIQTQIRNNKDMLDDYAPEAIFWVSMRKLNYKEKMWIISAIDNNRKEHWLIIKGTFSPKKQRIFFQELFIKTKRPVLLIKQSSREFMSESLLRWLYRYQRKIKLFPQDQEAYEEIKRIIKQEELEKEAWKEKNKLEYEY